MASFSEIGFQRLPALISTDQARDYLDAMSYLPENRVHTYKGADDFGSQHIPPFHPVHYFLTGPALAAVREAAAEQRELQKVTCWTSIYRVGERIGPHRDAGGDLQFLVVLQRPPESCAGALHIVDRKRKKHVLQLEVGDGFVFHASGLTHHTEPLVASDECREPCRIVAVGRYFFVD